MTEAKEMCEEYRKADQADDIAYDKHEKEREHYENLKAEQEALLGKKEHLEDDASFLRWDNVCDAFNALKSSAPGSNGIQYCEKSSILIDHFIENSKTPTRQAKF